MSRPAPDHVDTQIATTHRRLVKAMDRRIPGMEPALKERYFALLSSLVAKLETADKSLRDVLQESMADAMSFVLQEMQGS
jgi:hypothetical protein